MGILKRISVGTVDHKEAFGYEEHMRLLQDANDPESETIELDVCDSDVRMFARGPLTFHQHAHADNEIADWLHDFDFENIYWDSDKNRLVAFWEGAFYIQGDWEKIVYKLDDSKVDLHDDKIKATPLVLGAYPGNLKTPQMDDLFEGHDDY